MENMCEYFNTPSKHFVGSKNPFLFVFVLIWHFNSISSHFNSISSFQYQCEDAPAAYCSKFQRGCRDVKL